MQSEKTSLYYFIQLHVNLQLFQYRYFLIKQYYLMKKED